MRTLTVVAVMCGGSMLAGCYSADTPLVFGNVNTFGAQVAATAPDQGGNLTIGYRSAKIAVVPVSVRDVDGRVSRIYATTTGTPGTDDALSTFAHFQFQSGGSTALTSCLGDTFATGVAAQRVAQDLSKICH